MVLMLGTILLACQKIGPDGHPNLYLFISNLWSSRRTKYCGFVGICGVLNPMKYHCKFMCKEVQNLRSLLLMASWVIVHTSTLVSGDVRDEISYSRLYRVSLVLFRAANI